MIVDDDDDSFFFLHSGPEEPRIVARIVFNENVKSRRRKLGEKNEEANESFIRFRGLTHLHPSAD